MVRLLPLVACLLVLSGCAESRAIPSASARRSNVLPIIAEITSTGNAAPQIIALSLAPAAQLEVPFTSQAPFKDWNEPYQNACEEASLLTVMHYLENRPFTQELADQEILALTARTAQMGYGPSITMQQLADITRALYPEYEPVLSTDVSVESIQRLITQGKPVIIPAAGRILASPYYSGEGPWYHMLVVTGYDQMYFYTNDVGTGQGERYPFTHETLLDAIHDWVGQDERIGEGRKVMMTLTKK